VRSAGGDLRIAGNTSSQNGLEEDSNATSYARLVTARLDRALLPSQKTILRFGLLSTTSKERTSPRLPGPKAQETFSQLVARILDQLNVSAWLPAATLVFLVNLKAAAIRTNGDDTAEKTK
jgi:hypothetical protein